ncbi:MAG: hypothetical protein FWG98_02080 [Candidatus Cloacimonetes bacterium]|nr:hypothetical protein [Candidatus Cloacimonadota bacterium]
MTRYKCRLIAICARSANLRLAFYKCRLIAIYARSANLRLAFYKRLSQFVLVVPISDWLFTSVYGNRRLPLRTKGDTYSD